MRIVLASKSPRRREILSMLGVTFEVISAEADESSPITDPSLLVRELALRKGRATRDLLAAEGKWGSDTLVIASDTVVAVNGEILGKPRDEADARRMLSMLRGRTHTVASGLALRMGSRTVTAHELTGVAFAPMSDEEITAYLATGESFGKAGAYAVQGYASRYITGLQGDYFNVVGLPVRRLYETLRDGFGLTL